MTQYQTAGPGARPKSVDLAIKLIYAGVALSILSAIIQFFTLDSQIDAQVDTSGLSESAVRGTVIASIVLVLIISVGLTLLFAYFIGKGANWARIVYTVLGVLSVLGSLFTVFSLPILPLLLGLAGLVITVAVIVLLFRPDSNAFFKR